MQYAYETRYKKVHTLLETRYKNWYESLKIKKRALVIKGLRQIGKTTIVKKICEEHIADAFNKMHKELYYYHKTSGLEIDFVTRYNNELTLIEVKSNNGNAKSLKEILNNKDKYNVVNNFKLADTNIGTTNGINIVPLYMAFLIK